MQFGDGALCLCCGPTAAQGRSSSSYHKKVFHPSICKEIQVVCANPSCQKSQSLDCCMNFCDRVINSVPKAVYSNNSWVKSMLPYYVGEKLPDGNRISIKNCMSCCLSDTIPSDVAVSLTKIPAPTVLEPNSGPCPKISEPFFSVTTDSDDSDADEDWRPDSDDSSCGSLESFCSDSSSDDENDPIPTVIHNGPS